MQRITAALGAMTVWVIAGTSVAGAATAPTGGAQPVGGTWNALVAIVFTSYDPRTGAFTGDGSTLWQGTWTGVTHYAAVGVYHPLTGESHGQLYETFMGISEDGRRGTLSFVETYTLHGPTGAVHIDATIVAGTGGFTGATGRVAFDGVLLEGLAGGGGYAGTWTPPRR